MREQVSTMARITDVVFSFWLGNGGGCSEGYRYRKTEWVPEKARNAGKNISRNSLLH